MPLFKKDERIVRQKVIDQLFQEGKYFYTSSFRCNYMELENHDQTGNIKVLINVPKRIYKKAVDRNKIKRKIREAYRLNKFLLHKEFMKSEKQLNIALIYINKKIIPYHEIEKDIQRILQMILKRVYK